MKKNNKVISKSAEEDLNLVELIKSDNKVKSEMAFSALYKKYFDSLVFHYRNLAKNEEIARELVLKSFLKVSENIDKFDKEKSVFSTWLFCLTSRIFIDFLKKKKENLTYITDLATVDPENDAIEYEIAFTSTPESQIIVNERNKKMHEIIEKIKNREIIQILRLRYFEGLSYQEISLNTNRKLGTIKSFLFRAKQILKEEFENANIGL